ncbi:hypothetical protein [Mesorhizobium sp. CAU 1741]|uniref:transglycosylase SLT domain-containing protein n=1 Tax=Mesorhizobium sp. CAU 1741 TaxID=3140366 RepID=UPI00325B2F0B
MRISSILRSSCILLLLAVSACASKPDRINDVCAVFSQKSGWTGGWRRDVGHASQRYGIPAHVIMATIRMESGFDSRARPPRRKILGFIPGKRISTAYGYSQALDGTWLQYQRETGSHMARRTSFSDAADFVGWYHAKSAKTLGIARHDAYNLYLAYYSGHGGYARGSWRNNTAIQNYARKTAGMSERYAAQMRSCG